MSLISLVITTVTLIISLMTNMMTIFILPCSILQCVFTGLYLSCLCGMISRLPSSYLAAIFLGMVTFHLNHNSSHHLYSECQWSVCLSRGKFVETVDSQREVAQYLLYDICVGSLPCSFWLTLRSPLQCKFWSNIVYFYSQLILMQYFWRIITSSTLTNAVNSNPRRLWIMFVSILFSSYHPWHPTSSFQHCSKTSVLFHLSSILKTCSP